MNTAQAGAALGKSSWWVRRQCAAGELRASYYGASWNVTPEAITEYLDAHSNAPLPVRVRHRNRRTA